MIIGGFVQFIKSLFCWHGFDNRIRFISINFLNFISFIIINESFINIPLIAVVGLFLLLIISLVATQRRLRDAQLYHSWLFAPSATFLLSGLVIIFVGHGSIYWLLLLPLLLCLLLLTYPSKQHKKYIFGYNGPVDLSEYQTSERSYTNTGDRIEPTMNAQHASDDSFNHHKRIIPDNTTYEVPTLNGDIGESIRLALFSNRNAQITLSVITALLVLAITMSFIFAEPTETAESTQPNISSFEEEIEPLQHRITLPDNFDLLVSLHNGIVINWQADATEENKLWHIETAIGDISCQSITFNKGETIRSYKVIVEDGDEYFAYFSPLDTKALVRGLAIKGKFSLCGYSFSLKGSQAILGKNQFYADLLAN